MNSFSSAYERQESLKISCFKQLTPGTHGVEQKDRYGRDEPQVQCRGQSVLAGLPEVLGNASLVGSGLLARGVQVDRLTMLVGVDSDPYTSGKHSRAWEKPQGIQQDRKSYVFIEQGRNLSRTLAKKPGHQMEYDSHSGKTERRQRAEYLKIQ